MKKLVVILVLTFLFCLVSCGPVGSSEYTIKVSGTSGLAFSGNYMGLTGGSSVSKSVDGKVPATYKVTGDIISCTFQKQTESGTLRVQILKGDKVIKESDTTATYGLVSIATD